MTTNRTPVFHLDTLNLNFSDYKKSFFIGPQPRNFMGTLYIGKPEKARF
jgi:hypothetical protein